MAISNPQIGPIEEIRGGFHKPIYALRQAFTLCGHPFTPKKASQECEMALLPIFSLNEINPRSLYFRSINSWQKNSCVRMTHDK